MNLPLRAWSAENASSWARVHPHEPPTKISVRCVLYLGHGVHSHEPSTKISVRRVLYVGSGVHVHEAPTENLSSMEFSIMNLPLRL